MRRIEDEELKTLQIDILDSVSQFCEQNGLRYILAYGTLLGAVRHKGYIPWDDDIDIAMPRPDYEIFMKKYHSCLFKAVSYKIDSRYSLPFGKVYNVKTIIDEHKYKQDCFGVYIDVFPLDGIMSEKQMRNCWRWRKYLNCKKAVLGQGRGFFKDMILFLGKILLIPFSTKAILKRIEQIATMTDYDSSEEIGFLGSVALKKKGLPKNIVEKTVLTQFENRLYRIPEQYDDYLKFEYGNYMALPPENKRMSHHDMDAWWKD